jgi:hypothetical protein
MEAAVLGLLGSVTSLIFYVWAIEDIEGDAARAAVVFGSKALNGLAASQGRGNPSTPKATAIGRTTYGSERAEVASFHSQ